MRFVVIALLGLACSAQAGGTFLRNCTVFANPDAIATRLCRKREGDPIVEAKASRNGFVRVDTGECFGYGRESCVAPPARREPAADIKESGAGRARLGIAIQGDGLFGKVASTTATAGLGFAVSLLFQIPISRSFKFLIKPTYQYLSLTRKVTLTSVLVEPSELRFTQKIPYVGAGFMASVKFLGAGERATENEWWFDLGADLLTPLSGRQTDSSGDSFGFKPTAKLILAVLGVSTRIPVTPRWDMGGFIQGYYNVSATNGSSFYGARLALSLSAHL